ncbi:MAG: hypothetical protein WC788_09700 [Candidatus Paceibacterota bacterium]|jgi:hypothetical protein
MEIKSKLDELGLNQENAVVIGSGILNALNLREGKDIDLVIAEAEYREFSGNNRFKKEQNHGCEVLTDNIFEIRTSWDVLGKTWRFNDLLRHSTIIGDVRYITVGFLLDIKRGWIKDGDVRQKDVNDVKLMELYLNSRKE